MCAHSYATLLKQGKYLIIKDYLSLVQHMMQTAQLAYYLTR